MTRAIARVFTLVFFAALYVGTAAPGHAQASASQSPLFFREEWDGKNTLGFFPLDQGNVGNPNLLLQLYGPGANGPARDPENTVDVTVRAPAQGPAADDPTHFIWSGMAEGNWAATLKHRDSYVDLSRPGAKIRWRSWQDGAVQILRPVLKLADGTYVLGLQGSRTTTDYQTTDLMMADERWVEFDSVRVLDRGNKASSFGYTTPDLRRVDEIGFTTLSRGGGHGATGAAVHLDWIEVYGVPVPRTAR